MDEDHACNSIPLNNFKSKNMKDLYIKRAADMSPNGRLQLNEPLSPGANFAMRDNNFKFAAQNSYINAIGGKSNDMMANLSPRASN